MKTLSLETAVEPAFAETLQSYAAFCETSARDGKMDAEDCLMMAGRFREAAFVIVSASKQCADLRDACATMDERLAFVEARREELVVANNQYRQRAMDAEAAIAELTALNHDLTKAIGDIARQSRKVANG